jgi:pimeloyl-ACP methyl ester carboxylesterase
MSEENADMDPIRRKILATGAAAAAMAAAPQVLAQQSGQGGAGRVYEKGPVRIRYEEAGSGFPLLLIAGGGLNSTMAGLVRSPFNPIEEFKGEYRCIYADLRNAIGGQSSGPLEIDRPWKEPKERIPLAVRHIRTFLRAHRPASS